MTWRERAACRNVPTSVFFPDVGGQGCYAKARTYCAACPVTPECYDETMRWPALAQHGFQAGLTAEERRRIILDEHRVKQRCGWEGCDRLAAVKGFCKRHYGYVWRRRNAA